MRPDVAVCGTEEFEQRVRVAIGDLCGSIEGWRSGVSCRKQLAQAPGPSLLLVGPHNNDVTPINLVAAIRADEQMRGNPSRRRIILFTDDEICGSLSSRGRTAGVSKIVSLPNCSQSVDLRRAILPLESVSARYVPCYDIYERKGELPAAASSAGRAGGVTNPQGEGVVVPAQVAASVTCVETSSRAATATLRDGVNGNERLRARVPRVRCDADEMLQAVGVWHDTDDEFLDELIEEVLEKPAVGDARVDADPVAAMDSGCLSDSDLPGGEALPVPLPESTADTLKPKSEPEPESEPPRTPSRAPKTSTASAWVPQQALQKVIDQAVSHVADELATENVRQENSYTADALPPSVQPAPVGRQEEQGFALAVMSGSGGVGKSTIAILSAVELAHRGLRCALVDFDLQFGDIAFLFGLEHYRTIDELLFAAGSADALAAQLPSFASHVHGGISLFACPQRPENGDAVQPYAAVYLEALRRCFDAVIINTGTFWADAHAQLARGVDICLLLMDQHVSSIHAGARAFDLCGRLGVPRVNIACVLNRFDPHGSIAPADVASAFRGAPFIAIADGKREVEELLGTGEAAQLFALRNPCAVDVSEMLDAVLKPRGFLPEQGKKRRLIPEARAIGTFAKSGTRGR